MSPEAACGGPIAYVETGDLISYDIEKKTIDIVGIDGMDMDADSIQVVLEKRKLEKPLKKRAFTGVLKRYTEHAESAMKGAGY